MRTDMFWAHENSFNILLCNKGLQKVVKGGQAADSSGSMAWGCWAVLADPTSWCWTVMFHGRKDEAGCGRWEPPSWPYPQHDERKWRGETEAEKQNQMVRVRLKPLHQTTVNRAWAYMGLYLGFTSLNIGRKWYGGGCWMTGYQPCGREQWAVCGWALWLPCVWSACSGVPPSPAGPASGCRSPADGQTLCLREQRQRWWKRHLFTLYLHVILPFSSKAFLCASQSSSLDTVMPARGNFPCRLDPDREIQFKPQHVYRELYL